MKTCKQYSDAERIHFLIKMGRHYGGGINASFSWWWRGHEDARKMLDQEIAIFQAAEKNL